MSNKTEHLLEVKDLHVSFRNVGGDVQAVRGVDFHLDEGETKARPWAWWANPAAANPSPCRP